MSHIAAAILVLLAGATEPGPLSSGASVVPEGEGSTAEEVVSPAERTARAQEQGRNGAVLLGLGALAGLHAAWAWGDTESYVDFMLPADDPGPLIDPTPLFTPGLSPLLAGLGGAKLIEAAAYERGLEPEVPWTHWLGWVPASVAIGTELGLFLRDASASDAERKVIAVGSAVSALWFLGSAILHTALLPEAPRVAASTRTPVTGTTFLPFLVRSAEGPTVGAAIAGRF